MEPQTYKTEAGQVLRHGDVFLDPAKWVHILVWHAGALCASSGTDPYESRPEFRKTMVRALLDPTAEPENEDSFRGSLRPLMEFEMDGPHMRGGPSKLSEWGAPLGNLTDATFCETYLRKGARALSTAPVAAPEVVDMGL